ncbi:MAG: hypothetical protein JNK64_40120 [Myxococcales bacterium]|nr:hypothetical protein [Myxococcales bacterium]
MVALLGSAVVAAGLFVTGTYSLATGGSLPWLFAATLAALGAVTGALVVGAFRRHRPSWAFLIAAWVVVGFCAFFAPPKVFDLPRVKPVTMASVAPALEKQNAAIKREVMAVCFGAALPFVLMCTGLAIGRRDFERTA